MNPENSFWLLAILITVANGFYYRYRARKAIASNPELKEGYDKMFWWWLTLGNVPWIIMGVGILSGVDGTKSYFHPRQGNPFVLAFHASILLTSIVVPYWILCRRGAEFLIEHPGLIDIKSVLGIKLFSSVVILFWILWFVIVWHRG